MKTQLIFCFLLLGIFCSGFSQTEITGKIIGEDGNALSRANITATVPESTKIIAYDISNASGEFLLKVENISDSIILKAAFLGHGSKITPIKNEDQHVEIMLLESSEELKEVFIESEIIEKRGDTLNYSVAAFTDQKDRVIADVLRKMPGIEVKADGRILYQGEPIEKYYIEGLDLLEGRYNLANNNIAVGAVSKIQVLENHQPIKLLDTLVFSERASINIKLKDNIVTSGSAEAAAGFSPLLWDVNLTPMLFTKKQQAIVSYQSNNVGRNLADEIKDFSQDFSIQKKPDIEKTNWLHLLEISEPPFTENRWLDNNAHLGTANYLVRLKKDVDLKVNLSYLNDVQTQIGNTETRIFTPIDTISIFEAIKNNFFLSSLKSNFILEKNTKKSYFKNDFEINSDWNKHRGVVSRSEENIFQNLENPFSAFQNKLKLLKPIGGQLFEFNSLMGKINISQELGVSPGQFNSLLNDGNDYDEMRQQVETSRFFSQNSVSFSKEIKNITFSPEIGFLIEEQQLLSNLSISEGSGFQELGEDFQNNLKFTTSKIYVSTSFNFEKNDWRLRTDLPLNFYSLKVTDAPLNQKQRINPVTFEPVVFLKKKISPFWESSVSATANNDFGKMDQLFYGNILTNYRTLESYDAPILQQFNQNYRWMLSYRNPLRKLFGNISYSYGNRKSNLIFSSQFDENGATVYEALERENFIYTHNMNFRGSKYYSKLNTTISFRSGLSITERKQIINNLLTDVTNRNLQLGLTVDSEVTSWITARYATQFSTFMTEIEEQDLDQIKAVHHALDIALYPSENQYFEIASELYSNSVGGNDNHNPFLNLKYQYTFKNGVDLNVRWNNILNTESFINNFNTDFAYIQSEYLLRPSQLLLGLRFSF